MDKSKYTPLLTYPEVLRDILEKAKAEEKYIFYGPPTEEDYLYDCVYITDNHTTFSLYTQHNGKVHRYYTYKDGREIIEGVPEGSQCYCVMARHYWRPETLYEDIGLSASPTLGFNPKYNATRQPAVSYDLNSAYGSAILEGWIDTTHEPKAKIVEPGEIGFTDDISNLVEEGEFSMFVFPKCETPEGLVKFIKTYYERKKNPKDRKEKTTAKNMLNHVVGCLQNKNFWMRAYVVAKCNKYILDRIDENTLYWNTDCIVSRVRRPDLEENIGLEIGQWKIDHEGEFAYNGFTYQWNDEKPAWRSVPKEWIPEHYDILNCDGLDIVETNCWFFDLDTITFYKKEGL
jgi:hypothetical protein